MDSNANSRLFFSSIQSMCKTGQLIDVRHQNLTKVCPIPMESQMRKAPLLKLILEFTQTCA